MDAEERCQNGRETEDDAAGGIKEVDDGTPSTESTSQTCNNNNNDNQDDQTSIPPRGNNQEVSTESSHGGEHEENGRDETTSTKEETTAVGNSSLSITNNNNITARVDESTIPLGWTQMGAPTGADAPPQHIYYPSDVQEYLPEDTVESLFIVGTHGQKVTHMGKDLWKTCAYEQMETLVLRSHLISTMEGLEGFQNLSTLELYDNQISALECLNSQEGERIPEADDEGKSEGEVGATKDNNHGLPGKNLKTLDMSFNVIRDMEPVQYCPNLVELYLANNKIKEIVGLRGLTRLRNLDLGANRIRTIPPEEFAGPMCETLEELWLGKNKIERIGQESLSKLTKLRRLDVQSNRLTYLEGLEHQQHTLEELYLSDNGINDEGAMYLSTLTFTELSTVDMSKNRLTTTACFGKLQALEELWLSSNEISTYDDLAHISSASTNEEDNQDQSSSSSKPRNLEGIYLEFNPISNEFDYRIKLKQLIPSLDTIDGVMIEASIDARPVATDGTTPIPSAPPILSMEERMRQYQQQAISLAREQQKHQEQEQNKDNTGKESQQT